MSGNILFVGEYSLCRGIFFLSGILYSVKYDGAEITKSAVGPIANNCRIQITTVLVFYTNGQQCYHLQLLIYPVIKNSSTRYCIVAHGICTVAYGIAQCYFIDLIIVTCCIVTHII